MAFCHEFVVFVLFSFFTNSSTFRIKDNIIDDGQQLEGAIQQLIRDVDYGEESDNILKTSNNSGCACIKYNCGCCAHIVFPKIDLNDTVCANVSYLPSEYGLSVTVTIDNTTIINQTVSAKNPPPICAAVPYLKKYASVCIKFYNLTKLNHSFYGCIEIQARLIAVLVENFKLGCFNIPLPGNKATNSQIPSKQLTNIKLPDIKLPSNKLSNNKPLSYQLKKGQKLKFQQSEKLMYEVMGSYIKGDKPEIPDEIHVGYS